MGMAAVVVEAVAWGPAVVLAGGLEDGFQQELQREPPREWAPHSPAGAGGGMRGELRGASWLGNCPVAWGSLRKKAILTRMNYIEMVPTLS